MAVVARRCSTLLLRPRRLTYYHFPSIHDDGTLPSPSPRSAALDRPLPAKMQQLFPGSSLPFSLRRYSSSFTGADIPSDAAKVLDGAGVVDAVAAAAVQSPAELATDPFLTVKIVEFLIESVHTFTPLNWWACIAITTFTIRLLTLPVLISSTKMDLKIAKIKPELRSLTEKESAVKDDEALKDHYGDKIRWTYVGNGITALPLIRKTAVQVTIFLSLYFALSDMAVKIPSFKTGGILSFMDLTTPDPLLIFPALTSLTIYAINKFNVKQGNPRQEISIRISALLCGFVAAVLPKAVLFS